MIVFMVLDRTDYSNLAVMSAETRRHLSNINDSLRSENINLKETKDHLADHINGLVKR